MASQSKLSGTWSILTPKTDYKKSDHMGLFHKTNTAKGVWVRAAGAEQELHPAEAVHPQGGFSLGTNLDMPVRGEDYVLYVMSWSGSESSAVLDGNSALSESVSGGDVARWPYSEGNEWQGAGPRVQSSSMLGTTTIAESHLLEFEVKQPSLIVMHVDYTGEDPLVELQGPAGVRLAPHWLFDRFRVVGAAGALTGAPSGHLRSDAWFTDQTGGWIVDAPARTGDGLDIRITIFPLSAV